MRKFENQTWPVNLTDKLSKAKYDHKNSLILSKTWEIATIAHKGQYQKDGQPYINHIVGVLKNLIAMCDRKDKILNCVIPVGFDGDHTNIAKTILFVVGMLHDALEDNEPVARPLIEDGLSKLFSPNDFEVLYNNIKAITKKPKGQEEYIDYVLRVKNHPFARIVKIADLEHNMSNLAPGNLRDKYSLTKYFLEN